jgi:excisionase family DNA binding protein
MLDNTRISHTIPDACVVTGLSRTTLYEAIKTGRLTHRKYGNRTLILHEDLKAFIEKLPARSV